MEINPSRLPRVGILGGGQLGRMLCLAAANLGVSTVVLDPDAACPAHTVCTELLVGHFRDRAAVLELASKVDVLTVEIEHIDTAALVEAQARFPALQIHPDPSALTLIQDKYQQKVTLREHGVPMGEFVEVHSEDEIREAARVSSSFSGCSRTRLTN